MPAHEIIKPLPRVGRRAACQRGQDRRCEDQAQKCLEFPHIVMIGNSLLPFCFCAKLRSDWSGTKIEEMVIAKRLTQKQVDILTLVAIHTPEGTGATYQRVCQ